jgi:restriction endonuclease S subunit
VRGGVTKGRDLSRFETITAPYLRVANVQAGYLDLREVKTIAIKRDELAKYQLRAGDVLFTEGGDRDKLARGTVWHDEIADCIHQNHIFCARPLLTDVLPEWLSFASQLPASREYFWSVASQTVNLASISLTNLKAWPIPLPPLAEQRRIVERVEALLAQARTAREALAPVSTLVRQLRQAVLAAAFSGRLSEPEPGDEPAGELLERIRAERALLGGRRARDDARSLPEGLPELPEGWAWATVEELAAPDPYALTDGPFGSNLKTADYVTAGARVIRLQNIGVGEFKDDNRAYISDQKFAELQKHEALAGDIIIAALADPVGRACVVPEGIGKAIVKADCIRLRPNSNLADRRFVMLALNTSTHFKRAAEAAHGVGRERVNLGAIRNFAIPLAPLAEQRRIVARVEALLAQADVIEQAVSATSVRIADMERAVLARAFRGGLVERGVQAELTEKVSTRRIVTLVGTLADIVHDQAAPTRDLTDYTKAATAMANVQSQFERFNDTIRLGRFEENETLREKRDIIHEKLRKNLPGVFEKYGETCPKFDFLDQGSYQMDTGTKPLDGDYDIDQGIYFFVSTAAYPDPVTLKERVHEALFDHTNDVQLRRSCVTVFYQYDGEPVYHVDIAVYSDGTCNADGKPKHAKGKQNSKPENRVWEVSNPQLLSDTIFDKFPNAEDRKQFRRVVRYWKRWKAVNFTAGGGSAPNGIGLTLITYKDLQPTYSDRFANKHNDLGAMRKLVEVVLTRFTPATDEDGQLGERLIVELPIEPWTDVLSRMTVKQMGVFKEKLITLKDALIYAEGVSDIHAACERLQTVFGKDFPVPEKQETATSHPPAVTSSGNSA